MKYRLLTTASLLGGLAASGVWLLRAQSPFDQASDGSPQIAHADCVITDSCRWPALLCFIRRELGRD